MKKCSKCGETGNLTKSTSWDICKPCHNVWLREHRKKPHVKRKRYWERLRARYGVGEAEYAALLSHQGGTCHVCHERPTKPTIDHVHVPGYKGMTRDEKFSHVRGILCHGCNVALGGMRDSLVRLDAAREYLLGGRTI